MEKYLTLLSCGSIFKSLSIQDIKAIIKYANPIIKSYDKGSFLYTAGQTTTSIGILLEGSLQIIKEDALDSVIILTDLKNGDMFAESFAFTGEPMTVSVRACEKSRVMQLEVALLTDKACPFSPVLSANLLRSFARKNLLLTYRIDHLTRRTLSDKVMAYLMDCAAKSGSATFTIPFDRQQMADYLAADRSALSYVLSRLKKEGLISYQKNLFTLNGL